LCQCETKLVSATCIISHLCKNQLNHDMTMAYILAVSSLTTFQQNIN